MEHFFLGEESRRLFGVLTRPDGPTRIGLVFCPPLGEEMVSTYARMARWTKDLAEQGIAVLRYHSRGTGESDGRSEDFTLQTAAEDVSTAVQWMRQNGRVDRVGLLGLRFGASATVHASAGADFAIFWSPVIDLKTCFRDLLRLRVTKEMIHLGVDRIRVTAKDLTTQLEEGNSIDLVGYETSPEFYRQMIRNESWPEEPPAPEILWLGLPAEKTRADAIATGWRNRGARVEVQTFREPVFWEDYSLDFPHQFAEKTLAWLQQHISMTAGTR